MTIKPQALLTVVQGDGENGGSILKTLCVGRGHHVTTFVSPNADHPKVPHRVFASNLLDGTISVIGNDPADASTYLNVVKTINLCEPEKEDDGVMIAPNNARLLTEAAFSRAMHPPGRPRKPPSPVNPIRAMANEQARSSQVAPRMYVPFI